MTFDPEGNGNTASLDNDIWDLFHYKTDKKGRTNWIKIGRAWSKTNSDDITLKMFALPIPNQDGEIILSLVFNDSRKAG